MNESPLTADDFPMYFAAVHGCPPYSWQDRLTAQVLADGRWPDVIDLPTGTGKTAVLDTAVFTLAARPDLFPRRVVFVIDRRIVVDQVYKRAETISKRIREAGSDVLARLASALDKVCPDSDEPLGVSALRGGIPLDNDWATRPEQPWVMVSTVDQFGSKLLFRGYGVSEVMRPIHAGLAGNDCLIILDEVHLSKPFADTLRDVRGEPSSSSFNGSVLPRRGGVVEMSATPSITGGTRFALQPERDLEGSSEAAASLRRIARAAKRAQLVEVSGREAHSALPKEILRIVPEDLRDDERSIGVIVNRVRTAREVQRALSEAGVTAHLLTGRMRPLDRQRRLREIESSVDPDSRELDAEHTVVVATQAIEVGADFSFDALITEACPLDSLRQRVGRLDRRGTLAYRRGEPARCWVLGLKADLTGKRPDPIYGESVRATWRELVARADDSKIEVGPASMQLDGFPPEASAPARTAPLVLPSHMEAWTQTSPEPLVQPVISDFLHGFDENPPEPDVSIVWRRDHRADALRLVPPRPAEQLSVPLSAAKAWLRGADETAVADVACTAADAGRRMTAAASDASLPRSVKRYVGGNVIVQPVDEVADISPGDVLLVHPQAGGLVDGTWSPVSEEYAVASGAAEDALGASEAAVPDLGDEAQWAYRRRRTIRLDGQLDRQVREWLADAAPPMPLPSSEDTLDVGADGERLRSPKASAEQWIAEVLAQPVTSVPLHMRWLRGDPHTDDEAALGALHILESKGFEVELINESDGASGAQQPPERYYILVERSVEPATLMNGDDASLTGTGVSLREHLNGVGKRAEGIAERLGLPSGLASDLRLAGELHDLGKIDRRFQAQMVGNDPVRLAMQDVPLAKSLRGVRTRRDAWPPVRHEVASVALAQSAAEVLRRAHDGDLVLHLVATHHGRGRPLPRIVRDDCPQVLTYELEGAVLSTRTNFSETSLALDIADRFWRLCAKYGHHGLAWLEAILRLADHRQSEAEADGFVSAVSEAQR
ncbi:MAG: type I-U CRISPR-associated helicase/endonuclease Cas3 [Acidimicrobiaceae bacterium]|nr:type I-U CRISPR-associated helicase/endonuclease Cas3 [Acidimicrobiaceae bacterium]